MHFNKLKKKKIWYKKSQGRKSNKVTLKLTKMITNIFALWLIETKCGKIINFCDSNTWLHCPLKNTVSYELIKHKSKTVDLDDYYRINHKPLTHWGRVTYIWVGKLTIIGSDNGLSPERREAVIWTNAGILLIGPLGTNFSEILIAIQTFSFKKINAFENIVCKMVSILSRPQCVKPKMKQVHDPHVSPQSMSSKKKTTGINFT